jgi:cobalamin biosynthetic protein CobC
MEDRAWIASMRETLAACAGRLDRLLSESGLTIIGGTALYRLAESAHAEALHAALARRGILLRRFTRRPRWLRFGLPPDEAAWQRLERGLRDSV